MVGSSSRAAGPSALFSVHRVASLLEHVAIRLVDSTCLADLTPWECTFAYYHTGSDKLCSLDSLATLTVPFLSTYTTTTLSFASFEILSLTAARPWPFLSAFFALLAYVCNVPSTDTLGEIYPSYSFEFDATMTW